MHAEMASPDCRQDGSQGSDLHTKVGQAEVAKAVVEVVGLAVVAVILQAEGEEALQLVQAGSTAAHQRPEEGWGTAQVSETKVHQS